MSRRELAGRYLQRDIENSLKVHDPDLMGALADAEQKARRLAGEQF